MVLKLPAVLAERLGIIYIRVFALADRQSVFLELQEGALNIVLLMRGQSGVYTYKTKGTVLVFSWCGSGSIMPHKDQERKTKIRKGSCFSELSYESL